MKGQFYQGKLLSANRSRVCILFDPKNGRVFHTHCVTTLQTDNKLEAAEIESRARRHAKALGKKVDNLKALHLPLEALGGHIVYRVNSAGNAIEPLARPTQGAGKAHQ